MKAGPALRAEPLAGRRHPPPMGAILAGGRNRRYGGPKALATVAGVPILERVRRALAAVTPELILITNEPATYAAAGLPMRPDARPGVGPLGGIHAALCCARDAGRTRVLVLACDLPFLPPALLRRLAAEAAEAEADVVVPESGGPRGVEPLCACYGAGCIPAIEAALARGTRHVTGFYDAVRVRRIPLAAVRAFGAPDVVFLNINTPAARERAERIAGAGTAHAPGAASPQAPEARTEPIRHG